MAEDNCFRPMESLPSPLCRARSAAVVSWWDAAGEIASEEVSAENGWELHLTPHPRGDIWHICHAGGIAFDLVVQGNDDRLTVTLPRMSLREVSGKRLRSIRLLPGFGAAPENSEGFLLIPQQAGGLCRFRGKEEAEARVPFLGLYTQCSMPFFGAKVGDCAYAARVDGGQFDAVLVIATAVGPDRLYSLDVEFLLRDIPGEPILAEDLSLHYRFWCDPVIDWPDMAREYREYNLNERGLVPLRERCKTRPELAYAAEALEVRIRLGVKPVPHEIREQTPENEPEMDIFMTFDNVRELVEECARQNLDKTEFCLVGWNIGGHDGRYPQIFPVEERLGGETKLRETIQRARELGYQIVAHDCYYGAYRIAEDWDEEYLRKRPDGTPEKGGQWGGGQSYNICQRRAVELFAGRDMPRMRELGFRGLHYTDVIALIGPRKCYDPRHPQTRRQDVESRLELLALGQKVFGGVQSEAGLDWALPHLDSFLYCEDDTWAPLLEKPYIDEKVPFLPLVYHGFVLYNTSHKCVNCPPGSDAYLHNIEYGAMPLIYFHGHFMKGGHGNWLGDRDFTYEGPEKLKTDVAELKAISRDIRALAHLQMSFLDDHRQLAEGVFQTGYSDGSRVLVNYNDTPYETEDGKTVAPRNYLLLPPGQ